MIILKPNKINRVQTCMLVGTVQPKQNIAIHSKYKFVRVPSHSIVTFIPKSNSFLIIDIEYPLKGPVVRGYFPIYLVNFHLN